MDAWIDGEIAGCSLPDRRLGRRLRKVLKSLSKGMGNSLPLACQDWSATKAAYRFLDNPRVDEKAILAGHLEATRSRFAALEGLTGNRRAKWAHLGTQFRPTGVTVYAALSGGDKGHVFCVEAALGSAVLASPAALAFLPALTDSRNR